MASLSPFSKPIATRPKARVRTSSRYWVQVHSCQMPFSFSRMATSRGCSWACFNRYCGSVIPAIVVSLLPLLRPDGLHPQVGFDDLWAFFHCLRCTFSNFFAQIEDDHAFRNIHHDPHVVLNEHDGGAPLFIHIEDEASHILFLLDIHATHGLV